MEYIIDKDYADVRLDRYLRKNFPDLSLTEIFKGIRIGKIKVNGKKSKQNYRLQEGDCVKIFFEVEEKDRSEDIPEIVHNIDLLQMHQLPQLNDLLNLLVRMVLIHI